MKFLQNIYCKFMNLIYSMDKKTKTLFIANFILGFATILLQLFILVLSNLTPVFLITNIFCCIIYFLALISSTYKSCKIHILSQNLEKETAYNNSLQALCDDTRAFRHDFGNIVQAIGGYIDKDNMEGLKIYYSQLFGDFQKLNNLSALSPEVINNPAICQIIYSKYDKAYKLGINFYIDAFLDLNKLDMKIYEFSRILGILLDNAIEAASECDKKVVHVELRKDLSKNRKLLIVENTYKNENIDIERIFEKGFSSKAHNTGLGLWEVRQILMKNDNLNLYTKTTDEMFIQQLEIYDIVSNKELENIL